MQALLSKSGTQILATFRTGVRFLFSVDPRFRYQVQRCEDESEYLHGDECRYKAGSNSRAEVPVGEGGKAQKDQACEYQKNDEPKEQIRKAKSREQCDTGEEVFHGCFGLARHFS